MPLPLLPPIIVIDTGAKAVFTSPSPPAVFINDQLAGVKNPAKPICEEQETGSKASDAHCTVLDALGGKTGGVLG